MKHIILLCLNLFTAVLAWAAEWIVCPKCGRDLDTQVPGCICGYQQPVKVVVHQKAPVVTTQSTPRQAMLEAVKTLYATHKEAVQDFEKAQKEDNVDSLSPALYLDLLLNWKAMLALQSVFQIKGDLEIPDLEKRITFAERKVDNRGKLRCPKCKGKGHFQVPVLGGERIKIPVLGGERIKICEMCWGNKRLYGWSIDRDRAARLRSRNSLLASLRACFFNLCKNHSVRVNWLQIGLGALPREVRELEPDLWCAYAKANPKWCENCAGMGFVECDACERGGVECTLCAKVARQREKEIRDMHRAASKRPTRVRKFIEKTKPMLEATELCPDCGGDPGDESALKKCPKCHGRTYATCETCTGTGLAKICRTCRGEGLLTCRRCKGTGERHRGKKVEKCDTCAGHGRVICKKCGGEMRI